MPSDLIPPSIVRARSTVPFQTLHELMNQTARLNPAARAGVDLAAYDLLGKSLGVPVYDLLGLNPDHTPRTSFTIAIDQPEAWHESQ